MIEDKLSFSKVFDPGFNYFSTYCLDHTNTHITLLVSNQTGISDIPRNNESKTHKSEIATKRSVSSKPVTQTIVRNYPLEVLFNRFIRNFPKIVPP